MQQAVAAVAEGWAELVSAGQALSEQEIASRWQLGDLAGLVQTQYGGGSLKRYASEIGREQMTLARYRWVAQRFAGELLYARVRYPMLDWTCFEVVAHVKDDAELLGYLDQAADDGLSLKQLRALVKGQPIPTICKWYSQHCEKTGEETTAAACRYCDQHEANHAAI